MPVTPKYTWSQTDQRVSICVELPSITQGKPEIFGTRALVKVAAHPYFLQLDLAHDVVYAQALATVKSGKVHFKLPKAKPQHWHALLATGDQGEIKERREASIAEAHEAFEQQRAARVALVKEQKSAATDRQTELGKKKRQAIEAAKQRELDAERQQLSSWQHALEHSAAVEQGDESSDESDISGEPAQASACTSPMRNGGSHMQDEHDASEKPAASVAADHSDYYGKGWRPSDKLAAAPPSPVPHSAADSAQTDSSDGEAAAARHEAEDSASDSENVDADVTQPIALMPPRGALQPVKVDFTKLQMAHLPAREQREEELKLYKQQQAAAAASVDAADVSERQPAFLKDKGDGLFRQGNYAAARNAYDAAIAAAEEGSRLVVACRLNRAACHSKSKEYADCIDDCDAVLDSLEPLEGASACNDVGQQSLVKALARKGAALAQIGELEQAVACCERALQFDASNASIAALLSELQGKDALCDAAAVKQRAAARFRAGSYEAAAAAFALLSKMRDASTYERARAHSNTALCQMKLERHHDAIAACQFSLRLLCSTEHRYSDANAAEGSAQPAGFETASTEQLHELVQHLPLHAEDVDQVADQRKLTMKVLARCACCCTHVRRFTAATQQYEAAAQLAASLNDTDAAAALAADAAHVRALDQPNTCAAQCKGVDNVAGVSPVVPEGG